MRFPDRVNTDYLTLAALELAAVPLVVLVTVLVLFLGGGAMQLTQSLESSLGAGLTAVTLQVLLVGTLVLLLAAGGGAVTGYRLFLDRAEGGLDPMVLVAVPLLGVVAPFAYALGTFGSLSLPNWLFVIAVASAHALAFRTIAMYSRQDDQQRIGLVVGSLAGLPVVLALVTAVTTEVFVTEDVLSASVNEAGGRLLDILTWTELPGHRPLLVGLPLLVTASYAGYRITTDEQEESPLKSFQTPQTPGRLFSITKVLRNLSRGSSSSSDSGSSGSSSERSRYRRKSESKGRRASRSDGSGGRRSDDGSRPKRRRSPHRSSSKASDSSSRRSSRSSSSGSSDHRSSRSTSKSDSGSNRRPSNRSASSSSARSGDTGNNSASSSNSSSTGGSSTGNSSSTSSQSSKSSGGNGDASTGSDTRIFTDDFGEYGNGSDTVESCPACEKEIPSDGVYEFCPFCGQEL
jgi:hypothetical protein